MNLIELNNKLEKSSIFQNFKKENPNAFMCAGFFILNFKSNIFEYSLDFRDKEKNKIFSFKIPVSGEIIVQVDDILDIQKPLEQISLDVQIDLMDLRDLVEKALVNNNVKNKLEEIIAVLQIIDDQKIWNLTCMLEGFTIISLHINTESGKLLKFEKKSLFDMVKKK